MERLLIEGNTINKFERIFLYVEDNFKFIQSKNLENLNCIIEILEKHTDYKCYLKVIRIYGEFINENSLEKVALKQIGEIKNATQFKIITSFQYNWYKKDSYAANSALEEIMKSDDIWSIKTALAFIDSSIYIDEQFTKNFEWVKDKYHIYPDLHSQIIELYTNFVIKFYEVKEYKQTTDKVVQLLSSIITDSEEARCSFIQAIEYEKIPEPIFKIFYDVINFDYSKDNFPYEDVNGVLFTNYDNWGVNKILQILVNIFNNLGYYSDYSGFFEKEEVLISQLQRDTIACTEYVLKNILSKNISKFFFCIGLLTNFGNLKEYHERNNSKIIDEEALMLIIRGMCYFNPVPSKTCKMSFDLLNYIEKPASKYISCCMNTVYKNFRNTFNECANLYLDSENENQRELAKEICDKFSEYKSFQDKAFNTKDLMMSQSHFRTYIMAENIKRKEIDDQVDKKSVLFSLFPKQVMKYGVRNAHVIGTSENTYELKSAPYHKLSYSMELPYEYMIDPIGYSYNQKLLLEEVKEYEVCN